MTVRNATTVKQYVQHHAELLAMLENLTEFVATMPAPDENGDIPGVGYDYTGSVGMIHNLLKQASDHAYEMTEY